MSMLLALTGRGWLECPECGGIDLVTYTNPGDMAETIACRECNHKDKIHNVEILQ